VRELYHLSVRTAIARNMKAEGSDPAVIVKVTGLPAKEVEKL
jgi:hypothetical protein